MKKLSKISAFIIFLSGLLVPKVIFADILISNPSYYGTYAGPSGVYVDKTTAIADGKDSIKIVFKYYRGGYCKYPNSPSWLESLQNQLFNIKTETPGATLNKNVVTPISAVAHDPVPSEICRLGHVDSDELSYTVDLVFETVYLTSKSPGKVVLKHITGGGNPLENYKLFVQESTVTFVSPTASVSRNQAPVLAPVPAEQPNPAAPVLEALKIGSTDVALDKVSENKITTRKKLRFNGKTVANGKLKLYFQSDPLEVETIADKDGIWSYELEAEKLGAGEHTLQITVSDPNTGKTSEKSTPFKFNVEEAPKTEVANTETPKETILSKTQNNQYYPYILGGVFSLITILLSFGYFFLRHKKITKSQV